MDGVIIVGHHTKEKSYKQLLVGGRGIIYLLQEQVPW